MTLSSGVVRVLTLISGVLGVVLPNIGVFGLSTATQVAVTSIGGALLAILAILEHPNVTAIAAAIVNKIASK